MINATHTLWGPSKRLEGPFSSYGKRVTGSSTHKGGTLTTGYSVALQNIITAANLYLDDSICALGENGDFFYSESSFGDSKIIISYNKIDGSVRAAQEQKGGIMPVTLADEGVQESILATLFPIILEDNEAIDMLKTYETNLSVDTEKALTGIAILSDNIMARLTSDKIKLDVPEKGNLGRITKQSIDTGKHVVNSVLKGEFKILPSGIAGMSTARTSTKLEIKDGEFLLYPERVLSPEEKSLLIKLPKSHCISEYEMRLSRKVFRNKDKKEMKITNILLEGAAGSGKSQLAKALAHNFGLPYTTVNCTSDMDFTFFTGIYLPEADDDIDSLKLDEKTATMLKKMRSSNENNSIYQVIAEALDLPSIDEILYDTDTSWTRLTGQEVENVDYSDCYNEYMRIILENYQNLIRVSKLSGDGSAIRYKFYPSEFARAFQNGWLIEIQEPTIIKDASVLAGLNAALEDGILNLSTGIVRRHPHFMVVFTTNRNYRGCRPLNEAIRDRCHTCEKMNLPSQEDMIQRAMSKTGCMDIEFVANTAQAITAMSEVITQNAIPGVAGMRSMFQFIDCVMEGDDIESSLYTEIINKVTTDEDEQDLLYEAVRNNSSLLSCTTRRR